MKKNLSIVWGFISLVIIAVLVIYPSFQSNNSNNVEKKVIKENNIIQPYHGTDDDFVWRYLPAEECYDASWNNNPDDLEYDAYGFINCFNAQWEREWIYITYYDNWRIMGKYNLINWEPEWKAIVYYENWNIKIKWNIKDEELVWEFILYYENWNKRTEWIFTELGQPEWVLTWYYENWNIEYIENYKDWEPDWLKIEYYENWNIKVKWNSKDWEPNWEFIRYYEN